VFDDLKGDELFLHIHDAIAILDEKKGHYKILIDKIEYFVKMPPIGKLDTFLIAQDNSVSSNKTLHLKTNLGYLSEKKLNFNVLKNDEKFLITLYFIPKQEIYVYCVDHLNEDFVVIGSSKTKKKVSYSMTNVMFTLNENAFFTFDIAKNEFVFYRDFLMHNAYKTIPLVEFYTKGLVEKDVEIFSEFIKSMKRGEQSIYEFRLKTNSNTMPWISIAYDIEFENGKPTKIFGVIKDIDAEVRYKFNSERDLLTGCYNKVTSIELVEYILKNDYAKGTCYLIIIDIDNFKAINDNMGHSYGDIVLTSLAERLKNIFRSGDVIARIGGDEFMVFLKNLKDEQVLKERLNAILHAFNNVYFDGVNKYEISSSIGVSSYSRDGNNFATLFNKADIAMYNAKQGGKNQYCIYKENMKAKNTDLQNTGIDSIKRNSAQFIDAAVCFEVFKMLCESELKENVILRIFEYIGKLFHMDRCYIMKYDEELQVYKHTYQWCNEGIEKSKFDTVDESYIKELVALYGEQGIGIFSNTQEAPECLVEVCIDDNIISMLNCAIEKMDKVQLIAGYDRCTKNHEWNQKMINTLIYISKIIGVYLTSEKIAMNQSIPLTNGEV